MLTNKGWNDIIGTTVKINSAIIIFWIIIFSCTIFKIFWSFWSDCGYIRGNMKIFYIIILLIVFSMQIILAQSGAQYDYKVILSELLILIFLMVIGAIIISYRYRKCLKMFTKNEWDKIINSKKLIYFLRFKEKDLMIYILAISYFEKMDDQNFYYYINKLKNKEVINRKFFWIAIDALILGYIDEYWKWRTELIQSESSLNKEKYMIILDIAYKCCFENYRCTETEVSMINSLYSKRIYNVISY